MKYLSALFALVIIGCSGFPRKSQDTYNDEVLTKRVKHEVDLFLPGDYHYIHIPIYIHVARNDAPAPDDILEWEMSISIVATDNEAFAILTTKAALWMIRSDIKSLYPDGIHVGEPFNDSGNRLDKFVKDTIDNMLYGISTMLAEVFERNDLVKEVKCRYIGPSRPRM